MNRKNFSTILLPHLAQSWADGQIPFDQLVAFDIWEKLFPDPIVAEGSYSDPDNIPWYDIRLNAFSLSDGTLLLVYSLPKAQKYKDIQFVGLRLDRKEKRYVCYILRRPKYVDDEWEICTVTPDDKEPRYYGPVNGTWSIRCFWLSINSIPFNQSKRPKPWEMFKGVIKGLSSQQSDIDG